MFEDILTKELSDYSGLKLISAVYDKNADCLVVSLSYPDGITLDNDSKDKIKEVVKKISNVGIKNVSVNLKKAYVTPAAVLQAAKKFFEENFPLMYSFSKDKISTSVDENGIVVCIETGEDIKDYIAERNIVDISSKHFSDEFMMPAKIEINYVEPEEVLDEFEIEFAPVDDSPKHRFIKIFNKQNFIGDDIEERPLYISDVKHEADSVVVCGAIEHFSIREFTSKSGKQRHLAKFTLKDPTGEIGVIMFVSDSLLPKVQKLDNGIEILVQGECVADKFGGIEIKCKNISLCEIEKNFVEEFFFKEEPKQYTKVLPEKIEYNEQLDLFGSGRKVSDYLLGNDFVVFDLETTGLNFTDSEIIEIGAIKVKKGGIISEKFSTFVRPTKPVPAEITALTGITNEDVSTGVELEEALADFYKFTRGCTLVGHNVSFDYGFVNFYGKKVGYDFSKDNTQDTYALAQKYLPGMKNYKLKTVAEHFGVSLKNAHRAYHDAYATAEVFIKLADFIK